MIRPGARIKWITPIRIKGYRDLLGVPYGDEGCCTAQRRSSRHLVFRGTIGGPAIERVSVSIHGRVLRFHPVFVKQLGIGLALRLEWPGVGGGSVLVLELAPIGVQGHAVIPRGGQCEIACHGLAGEIPKRAIRFLPAVERAVRLHRNGAGELLAVENTLRCFPFGQLAACELQRQGEFFRRPFRRQRGRAGDRCRGSHLDRAPVPAREIVSLTRGGVFRFCGGSVSLKQLRKAADVPERF